MTHTDSLSHLRAKHGERLRWLLLLTVMIGSMASVMSSTIINVAVPDMSRYFDLGQERAQWVSSGFMVAMTVSMLTTPWLLTRHGYRRTYSGMMVLLLAGGVVGGLADHFNLVLAARVAEGLAAGVVQTIPAIIIMRVFESHEQGRASGIFGMGVVLAPAIGPSVGGVLVDWFGWRSIFFMVVPFCLLSLWLARRYVPARIDNDDAPNGSGTAELDWASLILASVGTLCFLNSLVHFHEGFSWFALALLTGSLLVLFAFWRRQQRLSRAQTAQRDSASGQRSPLLHPALFGFRSFAMSGIVAFIYGMAMFGSTYLLPVFMQLGLSLSASYVGTTLLPAGFVLAITIVLAGRLADHHPTRWLVGIGLALLALSFALMGTVSSSAQMGWLVAWAILGRIGLGFILPSLNLGAMRDLPTALIAQGASAISFLRMLGGAVGVSVCGIFLEWRLSVYGASLMDAVSSPQRMAAFHESFFLLAALCALALLAAWQLKAQTRDRGQ